MSEPRIDQLSHLILGAAIDEWNELLAVSACEIRAPKSVSELANLAVVLIPELYESSSDISPEALGRQGLLPWVQWVLSQLNEIRLAQGSRETLQSALQRAVSLLSTSESVRSSIEAASRRQVYELAYGLTHEINNPLGNIVARAQQLLSKANDPYDRKSLATVVDQAMRAHEMLAELMRAVQPRHFELGNVEVVSLAREAFENAMPHTKAKQLDMRLLQCPKELWTNADRAGLLEAMRLVCQNAIDACRENDSILWTIEDDGESIGIAIEDTGPGLSYPATVRAFDLFYSGREAGRGLGVSLAVVRRLVSESGGRVSLSSEKQLGCRVEMRFSKIDTLKEVAEPLSRRRPWKV